VYQVFAKCNACKHHEVLNHKVLQTLIEKVSGMERHKELPWDVDTDVNWSKWIGSVNTDLPEDLNNIFEDPNYILPKEVAENSIMNTSHKINIISATIIAIESFISFRYI
jgi:hypothetical protein